MEKRYQVFISSTFQDLKNARQEVSQALLRADCFPAGMELFPAADEEQFEFIKRIIDQSDYYILISAGRYGSIHPETGLSYTEMEYDYAVETGKPVIRLLHKDPLNELKGEFIERTDTGRAKLEAFREKLTERRLVKFWETPSQLGAEVIFGLLQQKKINPQRGWVIGDDDNAIITAKAKRLGEMPKVKGKNTDEITHELHEDWADTFDEDMKNLEPVVNWVHVTSELGLSLPAKVTRVFREYQAKIYEGDRLFELEANGVKLEVKAPWSGYILGNAEKGSFVEDGDTLCGLSKNNPLMLIGI